MRGVPSQSYVFNKDLADAYCNCAHVLGMDAGRELNRFEDLLLYGFGQWEASLMVWAWDRQQVAVSLGLPAPPPGRRGRRKEPPR